MHFIKSANEESIVAQNQSDSIIHNGHYQSIHSQNNKKAGKRDLMEQRIGKVLVSFFSLDQNRLHIFDVYEQARRRQDYLSAQ